MLISSHTTTPKIGHSFLRYRTNPLPN